MSVFIIRDYLSTQHGTTRGHFFIWGSGNPEDRDRQRAAVYARVPTVPWLFLHMASALSV